MHSAPKNYGVRRLDAAFSGAGLTAPVRDRRREDRQGRPHAMGATVGKGRAPIPSTPSRPWRPLREALRQRALK